MIRPGIRRLFRLPARGAECTDQDLEEEIRLHLELRAEQLRREGFSAEEARAEVQGTLRRTAHRRASQVRAREWAHEIWRDLRFGSRQLIHSPGFAATAILGIYGVIAYTAAQRTREIGIRMALGAKAGDVRRLFLRHGLGLTLTGIALGIGASVPLTHVISVFLFGVEPMDPVTYVAVAVGLTGIALLATYLPARHASRVDPVIVMRSRA